MSCDHFKISVAFITMSGITPLLMYARIEKERLTREKFDSIRYELSNKAGFREKFEEKNQELQDFS